MAIDAAGCGADVGAALLALPVGRRAVLAGVVAGLLCLAAGASPCQARADETAGFVTVTGVADVDETTAFPSLAAAAEAAWSVACSADCVAFMVHGAVVCPPGDFAMPCFVDGAVSAVVGADAGAFVEVPDDGSGAALALSNELGSLVVRGVSFSGSVSLSARDDLAVDTCSFDRGLLCSTGGSLYVTGSSFEAQSAQVAVVADLRGEQGSVAFACNYVAGFRTALSVACQEPQESLPLQVTSNTFNLGAVDGAGNPLKTAVLRLVGGPWPEMSISHDGNVVERADALLLLDATFSARARCEEGYRVESVADGTLCTQTVLSLFELSESDVDGLPPGIVAVAVDEAYDGTPVAEAVAQASAAMLPASGAPADSDGWATAATLTYDANGAGAGLAPDGVTVEAGSAVTVANMGSLVNAGFVFEGWNTEADGSGAFFAVGQVFSLANDTVLYAQWAPAGTVATMAVAASNGEGA